MVPWAAERATVGQVPEGFAAYDQWAGALYGIHMLTVYVGSAVLGMAVLASDALPAWLGVGRGLVGSRLRRGVVATRLAGPFNPPFWADLYTGTVGWFFCSAELARCRQRDVGPVRAGNVSTTS